MTKKQIKQLAVASFIRGNIEPKRVLRISSKLKRSELREYLKYLKTQIETKLVRVQIPHLENISEPEIKKQLSKLYPGKKIIVEEDPELLLGMKIIDNDKIYEFNLKNSFDNMIEQLKT